jgi:hypothetical protein
MIACFGWFVIIGIDIFRRIQRAYRGETMSGQGIDRWLHHDHQRLLAGCIVALGVLVPLSVTIVGPDSYTDFFKHTLGTHQTTPLTNHMGLKSMVAHDWDGRMRFGRNDALDDPFQGWKQGRIDRVHNRAALFYGISAIVAVWTIWALRRTKLLWVGMALSVPLMMCLSELTCYYYCFFLAPAALLIARPTLGPPYLAASASSAIILSRFYWVDDKFVAMSYAFFLLSLILLYAYSRPFSVERFKAWLSGRPETSRRKGSSKELSFTP